jgi:5-dehydro-2-deoxygluconokinase
MDVLSVGRVSVDLYAQEANIGFDGQQTFQKSIGGSPTNVAVAAARLGLASALATKVGEDGFGEYVRNKLTGFGVATDYVFTQAGAQTPLAFAALTPPETPTIAFYRNQAPDTTLQSIDIPESAIKEVKILWISQSALAVGETAEAAISWMQLRESSQHTIVDLDYRASLWVNKGAARAKAQEYMKLATIVVGNLQECEVALGSQDENEAADALLGLGVKLAVIKLGAAGVLLATPTERVRIAPTPVEVVCGLGAGDAFGGALCYGILQGWDLEQMGRFANAAGALVSTRLTCADAMPTLSELDLILEGAS